MGLWSRVIAILMIEGLVALYWRELAKGVGEIARKVALYLTRMARNVAEGLADPAQRARALRECDEEIERLERGLY